MGFYTEYFSTLLKGLRITALKERIEVRRVVNNLKKADHLLYTSLWEDVEKKHKVTKALKEEKKLLEEMKKSSENSYYLAFNLSTEEMQLLRAVEAILKELEAFSKSVANPQLRKIEREFAMTILQALKKAESEEREEFKQVMTIINEAEEENKNKFMANIRLAFQKETAQTMLAKFAARSEIRKAKVDILKLQHIPKKIIELKNEVKGKNANLDEIINRLNGLIKEIRLYCTDAFFEMFYIKKRISLITLKILLDLNNLREYNNKWVGKHFMPQEPVNKKNEDIAKIEEKISKEFHTIAQAFRIIIAKVRNLEKEAEADASQM